MRSTATTTDDRRPGPITGRHIVVDSRDGPVAILISSPLGSVRSGLSEGGFELVECSQGMCAHKFCWVDTQLQQSLAGKFSELIPVCLDCAVEARTISR